MKTRKNWYDEISIDGCADKDGNGYFEWITFKNTDIRAVFSPLGDLDKGVPVKISIHGDEILIRKLEIRICAADDCNDEFGCKSRKSRFCTDACRQRQWQHEHKEASK